MATRAGCELGTRPKQSKCTMDPATCSNADPNINDGKKKVA